MTKKHRESSSSSTCHPKKEFEHKIQLQLSDSLGFPVAGTEFWVTLTIIKEGSKVIIQFPTINFQTGPVSPNDPTYPFGGPVPGGYLYTSDGFLPKKLRPNDLVYRSILAPSNNGMSVAFSFAQDPSTLPTPPVGYILSVTNAGAVVVQCAGTFGNIIPAGPQIVLPTDITYVVKPKVRLGKNYIIDAGFTNTTQFTNPFAANDALRDSHVNDAFDRVTAWTWTSNANIPDKTNGILNVFVAIGKIKKDGQLKIREPIQLSNLGVGFLAWDTAVAINRKDKKNIVVSYGVINEAQRLLPVPTSPADLTYRAVSFDGGKTWPINGPTNIQPTGFIVPGVPGGFGDNPGVRADKFGNIWYGTDNLYDDLGNFIAQPTFWISSDKGVTFTVAYTAPLPNTPDFYDYPQYCFGGDGLGNYGLNFVASYFNQTTIVALYPAIGFIPITGLGQIGTPTFTQLTTFQNVSDTTNITTSIDGRLWGQGVSITTETYSYIQAAGVFFKSPGPIDQNYAGPWQYTIWNGLPLEWDLPLQDSQPVRGYITTSTVQSILYDDARQALYGLCSVQSPDYSQNAKLYFIISRDNGQTWSDPIDIANTDFANRGFQSMALDPVTGNLVFGWYDGRNDPTFKSVQYLGAVITAKTLDKLVEKIPLSNPLYTIPPATLSQSTDIKVELTEAQKDGIKKRLEKKFKRLP